MLDSSVVKSHDALVIDLSLVGEGQSTQLISQSESFFSAHDPIDLTFLVLLLFKSSEDLAGEHPLKLSFWEDSVSTYIFEGVGADPISFDAHDHLFDFFS
jgi:hypothetical protein